MADLGLNQLAKCKVVVARAQVHHPVRVMHRVLTRRGGQDNGPFGVTNGPAAVVAPAPTICSDATPCPARWRVAEMACSDRVACPAGQVPPEGSASMSLKAHDLWSRSDGTRHTFTYGQYQIAYEVHGSGDRVLVWLHGLLLDANLSRHLARRLAAQGNRVVLLDLLGHGRSDRPRHAGAMRMDLYAEQVQALLDELGVDQAVLGGVSLGTNVSLLTAVAAPERVRGLVLEMPVLESAIPAAVAVFMPVLILAHYGHRAVRLLSWAARRVPATRIGAIDSFISGAASDPDEIAAVLHGVLIGPMAPTSDQRRAITAPALVLGHGIDLIHSFTDAERLTRQLPNARLIRTHTFAELWVWPGRLTGEISAFLDRVWEGVEEGASPGRDDDDHQLRLVRRLKFGGHADGKRDVTRSSLNAAKADGGADVHA
jgi:pimeloyl-ACP methyl ester carboxylesterase